MVDWDSRLSGTAKAGLERIVSIIAVIAVLLVALPFGASADGNTDQGEVSSVTLTQVSGITPFAGGSWQAGCRVAGVNALGNELWSFTIWQQFTSNGSKITSLPSPTYSASGDLGWTLTSHSVSHAWVNSTHRNAYATGNYDFTQYVAGQPFRTSAGWVRVNVSYQGTWTCQSG